MGHVPAVCVYSRKISFRSRVEVPGQGSQLYLSMVAIQLKAGGFSLEMLYLRLQKDGTHKSTSVRTWQCRYTQSVKILQTGGRSCPLFDRPLFRATTTVHPCRKHIITLFTQARDAKYCKSMRFLLGQGHTHSSYDTVPVVYAILPGT